MKKILSVIITLFILGCFSTSLAQDIDQLWKARALQASQNLEKLIKKDKGDSLKLRVERMVEQAYVLIVASPDVTVLKTPTTIIYHLLLSYGDDGWLDVAYLYDAKTYKLSGVRVDRLPKNRGILISQQNQISDFITIVNYVSKEPMVMFSKSDPFKATVR
jgi:hypothetical protein